MITDPTTADLRFHGENVKRLLDERGQSQASFAKGLKLSTATISNYITGDQYPSPFRQRQLADALGVALEELCQPPPLNNQAKLSYIPARSFSLHRDFEPEILSLTGQCERSIRYCHLCETTQRDYLPGYQFVPTEFEHPNFKKKIEDGLIYQRVEVFFSRDRFVAALGSAKEYLMHENFEIRFYLRPPRSVPTINYRSFDDQLFVLGGYQNARSTDQDDIVILMTPKDPVTKFLKDYWRILWEGADRLWNRDLTNAETVAHSINITDEWSALKSSLLTS